MVLLYTGNILVYYTAGINGLQWNFFFPFGKIEKKEQRNHIEKGMITMKNIQITGWCSRFIEEQVQEGDLCIDATAGNGSDTLLLSRLCGSTGHVLAFDIQKDALDHTKEKLLKESPFQNCKCILDSHSNMEAYASPDTVSCIVFNFGYLPGGDHTISTRIKTSMPALSSSLKLLKKGGLLSLCIYSGGDTGFEEHDAVLSLSLIHI